MTVAELVSKLQEMPQDLPVRLGQSEIVDLQEMEMDGEKIVYLYGELTRHYPSLSKRR